ncbi:integrase family protein [Nordella sp. HKS 07]|uniref:tyrosine-type recombinase/integrase n=1 Tax=Nordella sp. HKS 07 TaxID=2712222 RepID=UPI0013E14759|nr:integrase family protein [Nordella sp. HKS 07]QIG50548.1 integrase family protein [Nordella sp. HKS 07]
MAARPLTRATVAAFVKGGVPAAKAQLVLWDARPIGFGLKLRASGSASWVYVFRPKGVTGAPPRTITIGSYPSLALDDARREALRHVATVAAGGDPAADLRAARAKVKSRIANALDAYAGDLDRRGVVGRTGVMSALRRGLAPMLDADLRALDQPILIARITAIATQPQRRKDGTLYTTPGSAREFRKNCHAFLAWCTATGLVKYNPLAGYRIVRRTRAELLSGAGLREGKALDDAEIAKVWGAAAGLGAFGALVRLGLLTGLRRAEMATLEWSDIGADMITIPAARSKMGRAHHVPLTGLMREILSNQPRRHGAGLVFPSRVSGGVLHGWSRLVSRLVRESGVAMRLHDTRRTLRTLMSRLGVDEAVAELCIGHVRKGLVGVYNRDLMWPARVAAFVRVSAHVEGLLGLDVAPPAP